VKTTWGIVNKESGKNKKRSEIHAVKIEGKKLTDQQTIAETFSECFVAIAENVKRQSKNNFINEDYDTMDSHTRFMEQALIIITIITIIIITIIVIFIIVTTTTTIIIIIIIIIIVIIIIVSFMQGIHKHIPETNHVRRGYIVAAILSLLFMVPLFLVSALALLFFYVSTFLSTCAVPNMAVFSSSLTSCFPGMSLMYFLNDLEMVPFTPIITGITLVFTFHMHSVSIVRS
jgi:small-conductance mechanosensitive channel